MTIITNFVSFPPRWTASSGQHGRSLYAASCREFLRYRHEDGALFLVNCDPRLTLELAAASLAVTPRCPLAAADIVLRCPTTAIEWSALHLKRFLLRRVDHYIHYFRDLGGYQRVFGIGPERSGFVPFKVNLRDRHDIRPKPDGDYVLCFGRSMRDYDTFIGAMEGLPIPAAIVRPNFGSLRRHGARFTRDTNALPPNIRYLDDDGSEASEIRILSGARVLVLPILKQSLVASGISTCLNAMILGKCVIGSEGPGMTDVFTGGEILPFPPENPAALADVIRRAWQDDALRARVGGAGLAYALRAGTEADLYARIIDQVVAWRLGLPGATLSPAPRA